MRQLVMRLEFVDALKLAHPFIKGFDAVYYCLSEEESRAVSRGEIPDEVAKRKQEDVAGKEGVITMHTTSYFIGLSIKPKEGAELYYEICTLVPVLMFSRQANATGPRKLDISYPTAEFYKMVKMWDKYDESSMHIVVRHIKQFVSHIHFGKLHDTDVHQVLLCPTMCLNRASATRPLVGRSAQEVQRQVPGVTRLCRG